MNLQTKDERQNAATQITRLDTALERYKKL
jgi:hypothetical protein